MLEGQSESVDPFMVNNKSDDIVFLYNTTVKRFGESGVTRQSFNKIHSLEESAASEFQRVPAEMPSITTTESSEQSVPVHTTGNSNQAGPNYPENNPIVSFGFPQIILGLISLLKLVCGL